MDTVVFLENATNSIIKFNISSPSVQNLRITSVMLMSFPSIGIWHHLFLVHNADLKETMYKCITMETAAFLSFR